jgi:hypothetical protein
MIMKKLVTVFALCAAFSAFAAVESQNVVGYQTVNLPLTQYTSMGWQFSLVGGNVDIPIASITNYPNATTALNFSGADGIRVFNSATSTYTDYFRHSTGWRKTGEAFVTTNNIKTGQRVMFMKRGTASTLTQSGEVINQNVTIDVPMGQYTAMCNPFPADIAISSITNYPNATTALNFSGADGIRVFNSASSTYTDYFRHSTGWRKTGEAFVTTNVIPSGIGFMFMKRSTASAITFGSPIAP